MKNQIERMKGRTFELWAKRRGLETELKYLGIFFNSGMIFHKTYLKLCKELFKKIGIVKRKIVANENKLKRIGG